MDTQKLCCVWLMVFLFLVHVEGDLNEPDVQVAEQTNGRKQVEEDLNEAIVQVAELNNGRVRGQTDSRIGGFPFIDGPITRPRPRPRPRPGLLQRMTLHQILSGSPSYLP